MDGVTLLRYWKQSPKKVRKRQADIQAEGTPHTKPRSVRRPAWRPVWLKQCPPDTVGGNEKTKEMARLTGASQTLAFSLGEC